MITREIRGGVSLTIQERRTGTNLFSETSERRSEA